MTLQTSRAICGTNRDRTALMYSTFRAEKQKQCPKKSGDAGEGIGNYVSPNRVLRRNRVRTLPEAGKRRKKSNRFANPSTETKSGSDTPGAGKRRKGFNRFANPSAETKSGSDTPGAGKGRKGFNRFAKPSAETKSFSDTPGAGKGRKGSKESLRTQLTILPSPLTSASVPLSLPPGRIDPLPTAAREGRAGDRQGLLATSSV